MTFGQFQKLKPEIAAGLPRTDKGVASADQVAGVLGYADGAIVGTALVRALRDGGLEGLARTTRALVAGTRPSTGSN